MANDNITVKWIDSGRDAKCKPNPDYPNGIDLDTSKPGEKTCQVNLPYPAKRCGCYILTCSDCGIRVVVTTAGRPDDPRSVKIACRGQNETR